MGKYLFMFWTLWLMILGVPAASGENLELTISTGDYHITQEDGGYSIPTVDGFGALTVPGKPQLPSRTFFAALPPGAKVRQVTITGTDVISVEGSYTVMPGKPCVRGMLAENKGGPAALNTSMQEWRSNYEATYSSDEVFPPQVGEFLGQGQWRRYTYVRIKFHPFQVRPKSGRLVFYPSCRVSIEYDPPDVQSAEWKQLQTALSDTVIEDVISETLVNYDQAQGWYKPGLYALEAASEEKFDYVIIVENETMKGVFGKFKDWKEKIGHWVKVVTLEYIFENYSGGDEPAQIRNFLREKYPSDQWGIRYVLLVGDVDKIPIRFMFPSDTEWAYASDYYYAKLTSDWDVDNDNKFGEFDDDNYDPAADVYVGRIPNNMPSTVSTICDTIISFEQDTGGWKHNELIAAGIMDYESLSEWPGKTDSAVLTAYMIKHIFQPHAWEYTSLCEQNGIFPSGYLCTQLSEQNFLSALQAESFGLVNCVAHGGTGGMASQVWVQDIDNDGEHDPKTELTYTWYSHINNIVAMPPSVVFLCGCSTGVPVQAVSSSVASSLQILRNPGRSIAKSYILNGAPAVIASTAGSDYRSQWQGPGDGNGQSLNYYFHEQLIAKDRRVGDAFFTAMLEYANKHKLQRGIRVFGLLGDPSLTLSGIHDRPGGKDTVVHEGAEVRFAADNSDGGDMYVGVLTTNPWVGPSDRGEILIYKSADHGESWSLWNKVETAVAISALDVLVGEYGTGEFKDDKLLAFFSTTSGTVQVWRFPLSGGQPQKVTIASETTGNEIWRVCAARDPAHRSYRVHLAYGTHDSQNWPSVFRVKTCRSTNNGYTWQNWRSYDDYRNPSIDAGPSNRVYLAAVKDSAHDDVVVKRSTDGAESWGGWTDLTGDDGAAHHDLNEPVVAASTDPAVPTVWVVYPYQLSSDEEDIRYAYSTNGGGDWTKHQILSGNAGREAFFHIKGYKAAASRWVNVAYIPETAYGSNTQIIWRYSNGAVPATWSAPRIVNDFEAGHRVPRILYSPGAPGTGSGVVYEGTGNKLYFSAPWLTGAFSSIPAAADEAASALSTGRQTSAISGAVVSTAKTGGDSFTPTQAGSEQQDDMGNSPVPVLSAIETQVYGHPTWQETGDLEAAFTVPSLLVAEDGSLYAGTSVSVDATQNKGVVFRSEDQGQSWEKTGDLEKCWVVTSLLQSSDGRLFAGGLALESQQPRGVIYRSETMGQTWQLVHVYRAGIVYDLLEDFRGHLYAATGWEGVILKSDDGGQQWSDQWSDSARLGVNIKVHTLFEASDGVIFAGLERSDDGPKIVPLNKGRQDRLVVSGLDKVTAVYDIIESRHTLYAATEDTDSGRVYQSDLTGQKWSQTGQLPVREIKAVRSLCRGSIGEIFAAVEWNLGPSFTKVFVKRSSAHNWQELAGPIHLANDATSLVMTPDHLFTGTGHVYGNVYKFPMCPCTGDIVSDGQVDLEDLQAVAGLLLNAGSPFVVPVEQGHCGDLNSDGQADLEDLQAVAGVLLDAGSPFIVPCE